MTTAKTRRRARRSAGVSTTTSSELGKPDPWEYATYHTMTLANMYSRVHWGWIRRGVESGGPEDAIVGEQMVGRKVQTPLLASDPAGSLRVRSRADGGKPNSKRTAGGKPLRAVCFRCGV